MADFSDLPAELIHQILYHSQPDDIDHLVLTSKAIYVRSKPVLQEHRILKHQYRFVSHVARAPAREALELSPVHNLLNLLKAIILSPRIGLYVQKLVIRGTELQWSTEDEDAFGSEYPNDAIANPRCSEDDVALFKNIASECLVFPSLDAEPPRVSDWHEAFDHGNQSAALGIIMLLCPNLCTLDYEDRGGDARLIFDLFENILEAEAYEVFSNLKHVRFKHEGEEHLAVGINHVKPFLALPSIESFDIYGLEPVQDDELGHPISYQSSNIRSLTFTECHITNKSLCELLEATKQLKSSSLCSMDIDSYWVRNALVATCKDSLEFLRLRVDWAEDDCGYVGTLKPFTVLQTIEIDTEALTNPKYHEVVSLESILPSSLRSLTLYLKGYPMVKLGNALPKLAEANAGDKGLPHAQTIALRQRYQEIKDVRRNWLSDLKLR